ncbi:hypothetical protein [Oceanobacter mangrovi]|uniref:hypothetical protein n=1 Tax=Oceanobacter mangrovi TaxID=2862510 RepID=UPI001C8E2A6D|nr:hypothetical protein [Oceanobacter mangrovi]
MTQMTFAELEYQNKKRKTHREVFLEKMDQLIPLARPAMEDAWYEIESMRRLAWLMLSDALRAKAPS